MFIFPKSLYNIVHFVFKLDQPFRNTHFVNFYLLQSEKIQLVPFFGFNIRRNQKIQNLWSISRYKLLAMIDNLSRCHSFRRTAIVFLEQFLRPIDQAFFWAIEKFCRIQREQMFLTVKCLYKILYLHIQ